MLPLFVDAFLMGVTILAIVAVILLLVYRKNGNVDGLPPEVTLKRQLETCLELNTHLNFKLADMQQSVLLYRSISDKKDETIQKLTKAINDE